MTYFKELMLHWFLLLSANQSPFPLYKVDTRICDCYVAYFSQKCANCALFFSGPGNMYIAHTSLPTKGPEDIPLERALQLLFMAATDESSNRRPYLLLTMPLSVFRLEGHEVKLRLFWFNIWKEQFYEQQKSFTKTICPYLVEPESLTSAAQPVSKQNLQHRGGCCSDPGLGGMQSYLQSVSEVRCHPHSRGSPVQLLKMAADCQGRPWRRGHQGHKQTCRHTALQPPGTQERSFH